MKKLLLGLVAIAACHKAEQRAPQTADALWALAPADAKFGMVITPRGVGMLEHGWQDVHAFMQKAPELADAARMFDERLRTLTGMSELRLGDYGLTADKGAAVFAIDEKNVVIVLPVGDRDRYLAKSHGTKGADADTVDRGTCKPVDGYYICVTNSWLFKKVGKGTLGKKLEARGDIEVVADRMPEVDAHATIAIATELERGGAIVRGTVTGGSRDFASLFGTAIKPDVDRGRVAGFGVIDLSKAREQGTDEPIAAGITDGAMVKSVAGPVYFSVPAGQLAFDARVPLLDPTPARTVLDHCAEAFQGAVTATSQDGVCHIVLPAVNIPIDAWVEDKMLRIGAKQPTPAVAVSPTHGSAALADGSWNVALWGRGSLLAAPALPLPPELLADHNVQAALRALLLVNEVGLGIRLDGTEVTFVGVLRTAFANPDDVVTKLATVPIADVMAGKGAQVAPAAATPLADDMKAGFAGVALPLVLIGLGARFAANGDSDEP